MWHRNCNMYQPICVFLNSNFEAKWTMYMQNLAHLVCQVKLSQSWHYCTGTVQSQDHMPVAVYSNFVENVMQCSALPEADWTGLTIHSCSIITNFNKKITIVHFDFVSFFTQLNDPDPTSSTPHHSNFDAQNMP